MKCSCITIVLCAFFQPLTRNIDVPASLLIFNENVKLAAAQRPLVDAFKVSPSTVTKWMVKLQL